MFILNTTGHSSGNQLKLKTTNCLKVVMIDKPSCRIKTTSQANELASLITMGRGITHDCNNLLFAIQGNTFILKNSLDDENKVKESITQIDNCTEHALKLLNKIRAFTGTAPFDNHPLTINNLIKTTCTELRQLNIPKKEIKFNLHPSLPAISADHDQLYNLMKCLITNSAESMIEREGSITITTGLIKKEDAGSIELTYPQRLEDSDYIFISVKDSGKGIPIKIQKKIFTPFFTTKIRGEGLGLSVALGTVRAHDGAIIVNSRAHKGSTFTVILPVPSNY